MLKILVIAALTLPLAGCFEPISAPVGAGDYDPANISYYRDARTQICFAAIAYSRYDSGGHFSGGLTHAAVPCTPEVLKLIRNPT